MKNFPCLKTLSIEIGHSNANESNGTLGFEDFLTIIPSVEELVLVIGPCNNIGPIGCQMLADKLVKLVRLRTLKLTIGWNNFI